MTVTFSCGSMRRQTLTALWAPGVSSGSNCNFVRSRCVSAASMYVLACAPCPLWSRCATEEADLRFFDHVIHHLLKTAGLFPHAQLAIGAGTSLQDVVDVIDLVA